MPGLGQALPPPAELLRYKNALLILASLYAAILVAGIAVGGMANAIFYVLILVSMLLMALKSDTCMSQCVMPFVMLTMLLVFNDALVTLSFFWREYPPASAIFSSDCPRLRPVTIIQDTIVHLKDKVPAVCNESYTIASGTKVDIKENACDQMSVIRHVLQFIVMAVDVIAVVVSWRMLKTALNLGADQLAGFGQPMMPPGGVAGPGGLGPGGGGPGGMGTPGAGNPAQRGDFQAFQGSGQTLSG